MTFVDLTLPSPAENLACDEALLDSCEAGECDGLLRFWEAAEYFVVLGYANKAPVEVNIEACQKRGVPVLRRCSGGGAVVQGPGCLNYSLILKIPSDGPLASITETNRFIMSRHRELLESLLGRPVEAHGASDLAVDGMKFSGNAQRRKQRCFLFHGTF